MIATYDIVVDFSVRRYRSKEFARRYRRTAISWQTDQLHASSCRSSHSNPRFAFHTGDKQEYDIIRSGAEGGGLLGPVTPAALSSDGCRLALSRALAHPHHCRGGIAVPLDRWMNGQTLSSYAW